MDADELYGLPLERFVAERTQLVKTLRAQGERAEAARVAKLAKPSVTAWAVNQLVRTQRRAMAEVFAAGDALQRAQAEAIAGRGQAPALREAAERERAAVAALTEVANGLLSSEGQGLSASTLERVSETLHAAALDQGARRAVEKGCLTRELRHVGLGEGLATELPARPAGDRPDGEARRAADRPAKARRRVERPDAEARRAAERDAAEARRAAERDEAQARREAERAQRELETAQARRDRAAGALSEADQVLEAARQRAHEAASAHRRALRGLERD